MFTIALRFASAPAAGGKIAAFLLALLLSPLIISAGIVADLRPWMRELAQRRKTGGKRKALAALCRARGEIKTAIANVDLAGEQHARLRLIGRSIKTEILEIEGAA
jgi:hypothetical protein